MSSIGERSQDNAIARKLKSCLPTKRSRTSPTGLAIQIGRMIALKNKARTRMNHLPARGNQDDKTAPRTKKEASIGRIQLRPRRATPATQPAVAANH